MKNFRVINFLMILVGAAIMGFGINYFNLANNLGEGGVTGLAILLKYLFNWDVGLTSILMNLPLFFLGWRVLGKYSLVYTIWGTLALSFFLWAFGSFRFPLDDLLLTSVFAGVFVGTGLGLIFRFGGTTGGVDIIARILLKKFGWRMGRTMFFSDVIVLSISLTYLDLRHAMYTVIAVFVGTRIIDIVQEAAYAARSAIIISDKAQEVAQAINQGVRRGATVIKATGAFTGKERTIIFTIVGRSEIVKLKEHVLFIDPDAFISIGVANEVLGEGFVSANEQH